LSTSFSYRTIDRFRCLAPPYRCPHIWRCGENADRFTLARRQQCRLVDHIAQVRPDEFRGARGERLEIDLKRQPDVLAVHLEDLLTASNVGSIYQNVNVWDKMTHDETEYLSVNHHDHHL
jgi:hypothetical protein